MPEIDRTSTLASVQTLIIKNGETFTGTDGSDSNQSYNTLLSNSMTFGTIAPGGEANPIIVALKTPNVTFLQDIRLGLIDTGGLPFSTTTFMVASLPMISDTFVPTSYFQGTNEGIDPDSPYNIAIDNNGNYMSNYVYLGLKMPTEDLLAVGTIRYKWFFNYA